MTGTNHANNDNGHGEDNTDEKNNKNDSENENDTGDDGEDGNLISAPMPCWGKPSSTVTSLLVFLTEALMVALSSGRSERRFITWRKNPKRKP